MRLILYEPAATARRSTLPVSGNAMLEAALPEPFLPPHATSASERHTTTRDKSFFTGHHLVKIHGSPHTLSGLRERAYCNGPATESMRSNSCNAAFTLVTLTVRGSSAITA